MALPACTRLIKTEKLDSATRSAALAGRATAYWRKHEYDAAIADADTAIAAAQIVNDLAGFDMSGLKHSIHQELRSGNGRTEVLSRPKLLGDGRERSRGNGEHNKKDPHALSDGSNRTRGCRLSEL